MLGEVHSEPLHLLLTLCFCSYLPNIHSPCNSQNDLLKAQITSCHLLSLELGTELPSPLDYNPKSISLVLPFPQSYFMPTLSYTSAIWSLYIGWPFYHWLLLILQVFGNLKYVLLTILIQDTNHTF